MAFIYTVCHNQISLFRLTLFCEQKSNLEKNHLLLKKRQSKMENLVVTHSIINTIIFKTFSSKIEKNQKNSLIGRVP